MGGHKSSIAPAQPRPRPMEGAQYKRNGYILPSPCLQGRHPPPFLPRANHGQTLPLSVFSFQSNLQSVKNKTERLTMVWGGSPLPSPTPSVSPSPRAAGQLEQTYLRTWAAPRQAREKATGNELWRRPGQPCTSGHSRGNKLAMSIAHLPAAQLGLSLNLLPTQ